MIPKLRSWIPPNPKIITIIDVQPDVGLPNIKVRTPKKMARMIEMFEENDDVQNIYHNWENEDEYEEE